MNDFIEVNPKINCTELRDNQKVSFVPMANVQEKNNIVSYDMVPYSKVKKGFTAFNRGDLIWAKITPCMQNGKSCVTDDMPTEFGFGSTEFHVIRKRSDEVYMPFIWSIFSNDNLLKAAQAIFSGSAGQQRVSASFLESFPATLPEYNIQVNLVKELEEKLKEKNDKLHKAEELRNTIPDIMSDLLDVHLIDTDEELYNAIKLSEIKENITHRIDPKCYSTKYKNLRESIKSSRFKKYKLSDLIIGKLVGGEWGKEPDLVHESYQKCLVLRATEISNKDNINIREEKAQFRSVLKKKLQSLDIELDDIIIEKSGGSVDQPVGRVIFVDRVEYENYPICYSNFLAKIKVNKELVDPYYLFEYLRFVYKIGLTEVMQNQTNGIRNLITEEYLDQIVIVPENSKEIGERMKAIRKNAVEMENQAEQDWQKARMQFEKELLGE